MIDAVKSAEVSMNSFRRLVQRSRKTTGAKSLAISRPDGTVVHQLAEVLDVWKNHFKKLGTPRQSDSFDAQHYHLINDFVRGLTPQT